MLLIWLAMEQEDEAFRRALMEAAASTADVLARSPRAEAHGSVGSTPGSPSLHARQRRSRQVASMHDAGV